MWHSVKKLVVGVPLLFMLTGLVGCATPRAQVNPESLQLPKTKIPLTVAVVFSAERRERVWQPDIAWQGYVPRPVYPGRVLADTLLESLNLIFERVLTANNEEEMVTKGADAFMTVEYYISAPGTADLLGESLVTYIRIRMRDLNNRAILSVDESGSYAHIWTAVDDGVV